ncbi:phosphate ABC transporter membrane protein 1 (PhoT family) [Halopolyspora algeriensis]|uniref:Phosphate transport system permease protein n=1 Tax=Halopolyspora algeriensis TaxID=1500506 RepID=A0A368W1E8_9ACTN|nr:phosphate ABC transporter permease subunit PstC [Halopolyspora algeriensis]RCW47034.1 phosphate ABC transporter membrane protein 1 (PhoT family) [Halopolyspora algeriensis]TQM48121.1 phosphate ABC transporter membrane protein 1 (PhoT family) [Halopolyspora algeriensis]
MTDSTKPEQRSEGTGTAGALRGVPEEAPGPENPTPESPSDKSVVRLGDRIFRSVATGSGIFVIATIAAIGIFLLIRAIPSLQANEVSFLFSREWQTGDPSNLRFGILDLAWITVASSLVALILAMPIACGIALFLTQYAPRVLARPFAYLVDLLAAVPSVVYGLWGALVLAPVISPFAVWLNNNLGWIPIFADGNVPAGSGANVFTAGIVLAVMILPIITGVTREVFARTPTAHIEGALALGATKWEVVRTTVWPFGRNGFIGGSMLGLGRALGETVALTIILSYTYTPPNYSIFDAGATFASRIALGSAEFNNNLSVGAYIAAGLVLFIVTFAVNALARWIESSSGKGKE